MRSDLKAPDPPKQGPSSDQINETSDDALAARDPMPAARFPVVGIGASAGGLEALEALTRRLSSDHMAYVVVQHLAPGHASLLTDILARGTSMTVVTVHDGTVLESNTIYVTPPDADISLIGGVLHLTHPADRVPRHSIDTFFRTLAADVGPMAIGVILSGAGTDGTLGLRAIKEQAGITFVQDPGTAIHASMPQSAIDAGCADFYLSPADIGDELMRLSAHPYVATKRPEHLFDQQVLAGLFVQLRRSFNVDFSAYKPTTIERRIERRMALHKFEKLDDYLRFIASNPDELAVLYSDLLIGVTGFFRDREPFDVLKNIVFPRLFEDRSSDLPVRIWVPGCSTGEEAYSIAICVLEYLNGRPGGTKVQIFATDIDEQALARARLAQYPQSIDLDVSPSRLQRFFSRHEKGYQVAAPVRDMILFARHNLGKDPPFSRLDLVSCRNVLIYMQPSLQRKVLRVFHYALNSDAYLLLGSSESVGEASDLFSLVDRKLKIYVKKNIASSAVFDFSLTNRTEAWEPHTSSATTGFERRPMVSMQQLADRKVLDKFGPPGLLVDDKLEVVQFRGQMGPYLGPASGVATLSVLKLVRSDLLVELRTTLQKAASEGLFVASKPVRLRGDKEGQAVTLEVMPLQEPGAPIKCFLVLFRTTPSPGLVEPPKADVIVGTPHVHELEHELLVTKEYLQTTVQELEASNEALQSSNEELQSSNEELQSTNEELETSREELQSTNEELATVNEELQNRMAQLLISNDDLQNVLVNAGETFVIVGMDLRIRRFSAAAERLLTLIPGDVGRPISYLGTALNAPGIESLVSETINTGRERAQRVRCCDGNWYSMRAVPHRTQDHVIRGALIEFSRTPPSRKLGEPPEIHELVGKILSTLPNILLLLDEQLRVIWVNKRCFETFVMGAEILGRSIDEIWPAGREAHPELWNGFEETAAKGKPFDPVSITHPFGRTEAHPMKFSARCIPGEGERPSLTLVVIEEPPEKGAP